MIMTHSHEWLRNTRRDRFTCECGVQGYAQGLAHGAKFHVTPYACRFRSPETRRYCGADAVHVVGDRQLNRCAEHAPSLAPHQVTDRATHG